MDRVRRVDHIAIAVSNTDEAIEQFSDRLGLAPVHTEVLAQPRVRLTYLDAGNIFIQLVEPLDGESGVFRFLASKGSGVHHVCFAVDDVVQAASPGTPSRPVASSARDAGESPPSLPGADAAGCSSSTRSSDSTRTSPAPTGGCRTRARRRDPCRRAGLQSIPCSVRASTVRCADPTLASW